VTAKNVKGMFFFEKKNQKTFIRGAVPAALPAIEGLPAPRKQGKSLFASFSSEKEVFFL
jgi:hypothetical protein